MKHDFDSDGTTVSDVNEEVDDNDFSQWTDSMDALVASFDVTADSSSAPAIPTSPRVGGTGRKSSETMSMLDFLPTTPVRSRAGKSVGNTTSPSTSKRHLQSGFDTLEEPPNNRPRQIRDEAIADAQSKVSPLRKTLSSALSLRTS